jgi:hypothetical protein
LGCWTPFLSVFLAEHGTCLGSKDLWNFDPMRVILCLRVKRCVLIISANPITQGTKTRWTKYYVLFSHYPSGFSQIMCRVWLLEWYCNCIYG